MHGYALFPFTAIVGQDRLRTALLLNAVNPAIGGVLIQGPSGTAKSTAVRGLAQLMPEIAVVSDCPFSCDPAAPGAQCTQCRARAEAGEALPVARRRRRVVNLPLNATEDRVAGTIDIARALREGEKALEPGLLAEANRGILYVDEINLLDDHLTDVLLDAAALGINVVEREGVSIAHPARFLLVGTMNEEEGDLRPQIADRLGLTVTVEPVREPEARAEVMRRREAFTRDAAAFLAAWQGAQDEQTAALERAAALLPDVRVADAHYPAIARLVLRTGVGSHRADITVLECTKALAALAGRTEPTPDDIVQAAALALGHRVPVDPFQPRSDLDARDLKRVLEDLLSSETREKKTPVTPRP
ncbi:MAG: ATP-binding protein [Thermoleophilia bacterium]